MSYRELVVVYVVVADLWLTTTTTTTKTATTTTTTTTKTTTTSIIIILFRYMCSVMYMTVQRFTFYLHSTANQIDPCTLATPSYIYIPHNNPIFLYLPNLSQNNKIIIEVGGAEYYFVGSVLYSISLEKRAGGPGGEDY